MTSTSKNKYSRKVKDAYNQNISSTGIYIPSGIYRGLVVSNIDPQPELGLGRIKVHISSLFAPIRPFDGQGASSSTGSASTPATNNTNISSTAEEFLGAVWCIRTTPFGGTYNDPSGNQISSGIFYSAPEVGNEVIVAFTGDFDKGIILGVIPDRINNMLGPSVAATAEGTFAPAYDVPKTRTSDAELPSEHPQAASLRTQGLDADITRGPSQANPTRDANSRMVGMSSPRGHSIVLDDGFGEDDLNNQIRIRTSGGAQILIDDNNGFIYIINQNGSGWMEINRNGDFDIFSGGSVNIHTTGNFNVHSDGAINFQAQAGIGMKTCGDFMMESSGGNIHMASSGNINLSADANGNLKMAGGLRVTAKRIDLNGATAESAKTPTSNNLIGNKNVTESTVGRVPEREPWQGHLDYASYNPSAQGTAGTDQSTYPGGIYDPNAENNSYPAATETQYPSGMLKFSSSINTRIDPSLLKVVEQIAIEFGKPLTISSGYRSPSKNASVGGVTKSMHLKGQAVDISGLGLTDSDRLRIITIASNKGIGGIGAYNDGSIHLDNGGKRAWGQSRHYDSSIPPYARVALAKHAARPPVGSA